MAHGIEVCASMLDTKTNQYVIELPSAHKVKRGHKKCVPRQAMRGLVPDDILDIPKKMDLAFRIPIGFGLPYM